MQTFLLDKNNNLVVSGNILLANGNQAILQDVNTKLRLIKGEYPFNIEEGLNYFNLIQSNNRDNIKNTIVNTIQNDSRISQTIVENIIIKDNTLKLDIRIITSDGSILNV